MARLYLIRILILLSLPQIAFAQKQKERSDANIFGHVVCCENHLPFVTVSIKGTTIGTLTDESGHYQLVNLPVGEHLLVASCVGYKTKEIPIITRKSQTWEINIELEQDILNLSEVIISHDRSEEKRVEAPIMVNTIPVQLFNNTQSQTLSEGLNFSPGLRLENNCQNCGFTQVRMNGMEGPYTQILINNRPIFSGLAGVYGLELIPANMIEKVEVVRGGGSALYGSNAIAGTINIILKEPGANTYEAGTNYGLIGPGLSGSGGVAPDYSVNINTSMVSEDDKAGIALYGFSRQREMFDANNDGFSEIPLMNNLTLGTRFFHDLGNRGQMSVDFFTIKEQREGGNNHHLPLHERDVSEAVRHDLKTGALTYEQYFRQYDLLSIFASGQFLNRDSYYGANKSLNDYGNSKDRTFSTGAHYKALLGNSSVVAGIDNTCGFLIDTKLGYPDLNNAVIINDTIVEIPHTENTIIADQSSIITGIFAQYELKLAKAKIALGGRFDNYKVKDHTKNEDPKTGNVVSPRISLMYEIFEELKARISYSKGFRAPQIFDEDLHIETSGSRKVINENAPDLKQETSNSAMISLDYNGMTGTMYTGFLVEAFYTRLLHPFVNDIGIPDDEGIVIYTRRNSEDGAVVKGINMEFKIKSSEALSLTSGFTIQSSKYDIAQEFEERNFLRTPNQYGYFIFDVNFSENTSLSTTGNYTGSMLAPYFGTETDPDEGELRKTEDFTDLGLKLSQKFKLNAISMEIYGGIKNAFNAYQSDFDKGINRDPAYIYGPISPRTIYIGLKIGNLISRKGRNTEILSVPSDNMPEISPGNTQYQPVNTRPFRRRNFRGRWR